MFVSFFPAPRIFFWSAAIWALIAVLFWFFVARDLGYIVGLENPPEGTPPIIGVSVFWSKPFLWFYIYYAVRRRTLRRILAQLRAASLVQLVDPRLGADHLRHLFPGAGQRRDQ